MSAVLYFAWHFMQCEVPMVPCRLTMTLLLLPAFSCSASKFCVASSVSSPACSSLTSALCAVPGCAFHTGDSFCQRQEYSRSSLLARNASMSYTFICSGCLVQTPSGPRKSGMPADVEMPAPVNTAIFLLIPPYIPPRGFLRMRLFRLSDRIWKSLQAHDTPVDRFF